MEVWQAPKLTPGSLVHNSKIHTKFRKFHLFLDNLISGLCLMYLENSVFINLFFCDSAGRHT